MSRLSASASRAARAFSVRTILIWVICLSVGGGVAKATPPIDIFQLADGTNPTQLAKVDAAGNLAVSVSNGPATQNVTGTVTVSNLPATQNVAGTVAVSNFPAAQQIAGNVGDARVTSQIALDELTLNAQGLALSNLHSTAGYTQVRVGALASFVLCGTPLTVGVFAPIFFTPTTSTDIKLGEGTTCANNSYNAVFDMPATDLSFFVSGPPGAHIVIATWAR